MALISPGVEVNTIDESFFIQGNVSSIPLFFVATADEKTQPNGEAALGTYEHNVVRTITSISQAIELYGTPRFITNANGNAHHGDARNEYGLDALIKYLRVANRAYVVRANVNLNDDISDLKTQWSVKISEAADELNALVTQFIDEYNEVNGLLPTDPNYKEEVTPSELKSLANDVLEDVFDSYSFSSEDFQTAFLEDNSLDYPGYQEILFDDTSGNITASQATGLLNDSTTYGIEVEIVDNGGTNIVSVNVQGQNAQTFGDLVNVMETEIQNATGDNNTVVEIIAGRIRITSGLDGVTSSVDILSDGPSGTTALLANLNLFDSLADPVSGKGADPLDMYDSNYQTIIGTYDGLDFLIDAQVDFTAADAEGVLLVAGSDFATTKEFRNLTSLGANDSARRATIVQQLIATVNNPDNMVRSPRFNYNLVATPGYWEPTSSLLTLSDERKEEVFVIADTPFNRPPTGPNSILEWYNQNGVPSARVAYYYPHCVTRNTDGAEILSSAASCAGRVYAYNDNVAELWYAPAGPQRGVMSFVSSSGYVTGQLGTATTFVQEDVDEGTADALYESNVNYFQNIFNRGIIAMPQNTTLGSTSALSKINVSRLICYIRRQLRFDLFTFLQDPNDEITRGNVRAATESFLGELLGRRALFDFAVSVDSDVDAGEITVDIALKPTRAVEFIYVDLRVLRNDAEMPAAA